MPANDQIGFFLLAALAVGMGLGVILARFVANRFAHVNEVRWKRRFNEMQAEHELSIGKLNKMLRHSREKQETLRLALDESDETVRLLSAESAPTFERDVIERNIRIAELEKKLSRSRAKAADAEDHEAILQKRIDDLLTELSQQREKALLLEHTIADTHSVKQKNNGTKHPGARVISIHEHVQSNDLTSRLQFATDHDSTQQRIQTLQRELDQWKCKYETANRLRDKDVPDPAVTTTEQPGYPAGQTQSKDNLKLIRGIGPVLETALNELGFFQFEQLASMDQPDIEQMARYDSSLPGRMRRYNWSEQARKLQRSQPGDQRRPGA